MIVSSGQDVTSANNLSVDRAALAEQLEERQHRPWWRKPTPWWQICLFPISVLAIAATLPAKLELVNKVACRNMYASEVPAGGCNTNPKVQAAAASILSMNMAVAGIICCFTGPIWGSLSDRYGRMVVQRLYALGPFLSDIICLLVYFSYEQFPIGRHGILLSSIIEGVLAVGTFTASQAYISDVTEPDTRSTWFTLFRGGCFVGSCLGPFISSTIAHFTGDIAMVYITAIGIHTVFLVATLAIIPESVLGAQMELAQAKHRLEASIHTGNGRGLVDKIRSAIWSGIEPLSVFIPSSYPHRDSPRKLVRRNWNLTLVGLAYFPDTLLEGAGLFYLQYGIGIYDWTTEDTGLVLGINSFAKVAFLLSILPWIIRAFRPVSAPIPSRGSSPTREHANTESTPLVPASRERNAAHDRGVKWDIDLMRVSLVLQLGAVSFMAFAKNSTLFMLGVVAVSLSSGFVPTLQSVALEFYRRQGGVEAGKLFGALNMIYVLGQQIFGPSLFGFTYAKSIETIPQFIFFLGAGFCLCSITTVAFIRVPPDNSKDLGTAAAEDEESLAM